MPAEKKPFRFAFINAFTTPAQKAKQPKEKTLQNYDNIKHLLEDVEWDAYPGGDVTYGDWPVETREELLYAAAARLPVVRKACETGKYNAVILLGGADPGFLEAREIAHKYHIALTSCGHASYNMACVLGHKFSVIYLPGAGLPKMHQIVSTYYLGERCASIRHLSIHLPRPGYDDAVVLEEEKQKALAGKRSEAVERAVVEAVDAIENDGADVITFGCSGLYWLTPFLQKRLDDLKWDVPVLDGYTCAILQAKSLVALGRDCSGLTWPPDRPEKLRRRKLY